MPDRPDRPAYLHFSLGGFSGYSWELLLEHDLLWFRDCPHGGGPLGHQPWLPCPDPGPAAWHRLGRLLDGLGFRDWPDTFVERGVLDGTQWSFDLRWGDRERRIYGSNAFPEGFRHLERTFRRMARERDPHREPMESPA
jgi:hypothetical protein